VYVRPHRPRYNLAPEVSVSFEELRAQALNLDLRSRALLAEVLLESLEEPSPDEVFDLALAEAERRQAQVRDGSVRMVPGDEVLERLTRAVG
jgi:hypothetical protein